MTLMWERKWRALGLICLCLLLFISSTVPLLAANKPVARNLILLIGDGMGPVQVDLARQAIKLRGGLFNLDRFSVKGESLTSSANQEVTDSAAGATALATGHRTNNGMIAVTPEGTRLPTILEWCRDHGKATGVVTTDSLTGATPTSFSAHAQSRREYTQLAEQMITARIDLLLGGGESSFRPKTFPGSPRTDERDLVAEAQQSGYTLVRTREELNRARGPRLLGLFANATMTFALDRKTTAPEQPSLAEMTRAALKHLATHRNGFFLMVEGGKIDTACHWNDAAAAIAEVLDFDQAVGAAFAFARQHPETLVVVTADHETGGLRLTDKLEVQQLMKSTASTEFMQRQLDKQRTNVESVLRQYAQCNISLTPEQRDTLAKANNPGVILGSILSQASGIEWSGTGHTSQPVPILTYGPGAGSFSGRLENAEVGKRLAQVIDASP